MKKTALALITLAAGLTGTAHANDAGKAIYDSTCTVCHGPTAQGMAIYPKLAGQSADDLAAKLQTYKAGEQVGAMSAVMFPTAQGLSDEDIQAVTAYIATFE